MMTRTQRPVSLVRLGLGAAALLAVVLAPASVAAAGSKVAPRIPLAGASVIGWGFNGPYGVSSDGTHVWVANQGGNSVIELAAATGALVKVISGSSYGFNGPYGVSSDGTHVWVANYGGNSVTELAAATGALVKVISGSSYGFNNPDAVSSDGTHVWVANRGGQSVTELPAS